MSQRRVVITGLGCVTSLGIAVDQVWRDITAGTSGVRHIRTFDTADFKTTFGGEVSEWDGGPHLEKAEAKRLDRFAQFAIHGAVDAVKESGLDFEKEDLWRCGAIIGTGIGGIDTTFEGSKTLIAKGPGRVSPFVIPKTMCNAGSGNVSIRFGLRGPNSAIATACASAGHAIGEAANTIRLNAADVIVTGGTEAALTPLCLASFSSMRALSRRNDDPAAASRPFDRDRDGFILSEGAGIIVIEEYEHAKARGAEIYAEILGYGQSADGSHITAPDEQGRGASYAMEAALRDAKVNPDQVSYINAHGTSTPLGDLAETRAVKNLFGDHAAKIPISSTKSMTGHLLGASGGIEAMFCALAIRHRTIPPTINLDNPDDGCSNLDFVPHTARQQDVKIAMSNSFGFGGHNVSLVLGKV